MSGHSHFATIKRQKGIKDAAKGQIFSKMSRAISIAVKLGGGSDPDSNYKLRMAVDAARTVNMPKDNIQRAINKASEEGDLEQVLYEGFAPGGVAVIVDVATNNRNRTGQEMKNVFEKNGGTLGGPGSVAYNFETKGLIIVEISENKDSQMLSLIDCGAEDIQEEQDGIEVYTSIDKMQQLKEVIEQKAGKVKSAQIIQKPINLVEITNANLAGKIINFLEKLDELEDVVQVYANMDIPKEILIQLQAS